MFAIQTKTGNYYSGTKSLEGSRESFQVGRIASVFTAHLNEARMFDTTLTAETVADSINEEYRDWCIDAGAVVVPIV